MKAYKGFNPDMTCRGFKYEEGQTYETDNASICQEGFHACINPLDCLGYYSPSESIYREVEIDGLDESEDAKEQEDSKVCGRKITIGAKLDVKWLVKASFDFMMEHCGKSKEILPAINSGDRSMASNSGDRSMASNSGYRSMASNSGHRSMASNSGNSSMASNSGDSSIASNSGDSSIASNSGDSSMASNSGHRSMASNSGHSSMASNSGYISMASNSGDSSMASNSGNSSMASNSGDRSMASNSGDRSMASNSGEEGIACAIGVEGKAKGCLGTWLILAEWKFNYDERKWHRIDVQCRQVDGEKIKADTYYQLVNGEFQETEEE